MTAAAIDANMDLEIAMDLVIDSCVVISGLIIEDRLHEPAKANSGFGERLIALRRMRNMTQVQLAEAAGTSQRAISYYETTGNYPPAPALIELARALHVSADELLGLKAAKADDRAEDPEMRRLWKKFQLVSTLPDKDQRAVIRLINSLARSEE